MSATTNGPAHVTYECLACGRDIPVNAAKVSDEGATVRVTADQYGVRHWRYCKGRP